MEVCVQSLVCYPAAAHKMGIAGLVVPDSNVQEAAVVEGLAVYGFKYLSEVADFLNKPERYQPVELEHRYSKTH